MIDLISLDNNWRGEFSFKSLILFLIAMMLYLNYFSKLMGPQKCVTSLSSLNTPPVPYRGSNIESLTG